MGLNDVRSPNIRNHFVREMEEWARVVSEHGKKFGVHNTIGMARLLNAPALVWFPADGELPYPSYRNYVKEVTFINHEIDMFNERQVHLLLLP